MTQEIIQKIQKSKTKVVIVSGDSASGKGFLVNSLFQNSELKFKILGMDDYYKSEEDLKILMGEMINWDVPEAVKIDLFCSHVQALKLGKEVQKPFYINQYSGTGYEDFGRKIKLEKNQILLVEGVFSSLTEICNLADFVIYNSSSIHSRLIRRIIRDYGFQKNKIENKNKFLEELLLELLQVVFPENKKYCKPKKIDFVFENEITIAEIQSDQNTLFQKIDNSKLEEILNFAKFYKIKNEVNPNLNISGIALSNNKIFILKEFSKKEIYVLEFNFEKEKKPLFEKLMSKFYSNSY